jgi:hypothetical protein
MTPIRNAIASDEIGAARVTALTWSSHVGCGATSSARSWDMPRIASVARSIRCSLSAVAMASSFVMNVERVEAGLPFKCHPHMLRHACGFALANKGHDTRALQAYLGHKNIQHTVRYTELSPTRFKDFWRT